MKFNSKAYDELYPRPKKVEKAETAVEGFTPSVEEPQTETTAPAAESEVNDGGDGADSPAGE